jgi:hypothetical protein
VKPQASDPRLLVSCQFIRSVTHDPQAANDVGNDSRSVILCDVTFGNNFQNNVIGVNPDSASGTAFGALGMASNDSRSFQFQARLKF